MQRLRLLYVCGTYAPGAFAGSELSAHQLLRALMKNFFIDVLVATDASYTGGNPCLGIYEGVPLCGIKREEKEVAIARLVDQWRPDAILTQLLWADVALSLGNEKGIPTILRLISIPTNLDLSRPAAIVTNAEFSSQWVRERWGRDAHCIASFVDLERALVSEPDRVRRLIMMFNPINVKGGLIFHEIARRQPQRQFGVVPGWYSLRRPDGKWDRTILRDWVPEDVDFSDLANVEVLRPRERVAEIYAQTRILIVPSQWDETFARVCFEAYANGIPVIGSAVAGLREHVEVAGFAIKEKSSIDAWISAIEALDEQHLYDHYCQLGLNFVRQKYSQKAVCESFIALLLQLKAK